MVRGKKGYICLHRVLRCLIAALQSTPFLEPQLHINFRFMVFLTAKDHKNYIFFKLQLTVSDMMYVISS